MRLAEKFGLPIISFIDTPGAYPGISAEERGQAAIIAENLMAMSQIRTPIVGVVIGEGGSGGALGIGIGDRLAMLEFTYYSVISPEGCASIFWKGSEHAPKAAAALKMTSRDLLRFGIIDEIIAEPAGGAHRDHREAAASLKTFLIHAIRQLKEIPTDRLLRLSGTTNTARSASFMKSHRPSLRASLSPSGTGRRRRRNRAGSDAFDTGSATPIRRVSGVALTCEVGGSPSEPRSHDRGHGWPGERYALPGECRDEVAAGLTVVVAVQGAAQRIVKIGRDDLKPVSLREVGFGFENERHRRCRRARSGHDRRQLDRLELRDDVLLDLLGRDA